MNRNLKLAPADWAGYIRSFKFFPASLVCLLLGNRKVSSHHYCVLTHNNIQRWICCHHGAWSNAGSAVIMALDPTLDLLSSCHGAWSNAGSALLSSPSPPLLHFDRNLNLASQQTVYWCIDESPQAQEIRALRRSEFSGDEDESILW